MFECLGLFLWIQNILSVSALGHLQTTNASFSKLGNFVSKVTFTSYVLLHSLSGERRIQ